MSSTVASPTSSQRAPSSPPAETPARRLPSPSRAMTRRVLLAAIGPDPLAVASMGAVAGERLDWDWLLERARAHKVAALLAARVVEQAWAVSLPAGIRGALDEIRGQAQRRAAGARRTLQEVARALTAGGIPFVVLKGSVLAEQAYKDPVRRPFYDVDLLVPLQRLDDAEAALIALGYRFHSPPLRALTFVPPRLRPVGPPDARVSERVARALYRTYHYHFVYLPPPEDERLPVELHWHVATPRTFPAGPSALWAHATPTVVAETEVQALDLESTLVYVAWHAIKDGAARLRLLHLCDVAWLLARFGPSYQPHRVWAVAGAWHVRHHLARALEAVRHLWAVPGVPLPASRGTLDRLLHLSFRLAGDPCLIGAPRSRGGLRGLAGDLLTETLWELALARLPRRAARRLLAAGRARLPRLRATSSSAEP
jgi:Uncharacterised nucleotidyltransferase